MKYQVNDILKSFTDAQKTRIGLMRHIAQTLTKTTGNSFILKGGTALLLAYGLPRYSTDLDYDGRDRNIDIARQLRTSAERAGIQIDSLNLKKDTETVKRYMMHYKGSENDPLKIEISFRQAFTINDKDITVIDGIGWAAFLLHKIFLDNNLSIIYIICVSREWLSGRASPCQGEGRGFESRFALSALMA